MKSTIIKDLEHYGFSPEIAEIRKGFYDYSGFPQPLKKYWLGFKSENYSVEEMYFWMLGHATNDQAVPYIHKITDIFAASQGSSVFGDLNARMSALQNQASQLLATTSNMTKDLFKRVRELRTIRERLAYYEKADTSKSIEERKKSDAVGAEATLKDIWANMVEGGGENPSSIYGMARKVNFVILPDLFLQTPPLRREEIKKYVEDLDFNPAVKMQLERKLYQFHVWKENTHKELLFKEKFQKKLIYQHYMNVKQYLTWIKPYLKNVKKLTMDEGLDTSHALITSFQSNLVEIEVLLQIPTGSFTYLDTKGETPEVKQQNYNGIISMHFLYQTEPSMDYHAKDSWQQKGPIHIGRADVQMRCYAWTDEELQKYKKMKAKEELDLLTAIDYTLKDDAELLGPDLKEILDEVKIDLEGKLDIESMEKVEKEKKQEKSKGPFSALFDGFKDLGFSSSTSDKPKAPKISPKEMKSWNVDKEKAKAGAKGAATGIAWQCYKNYKKAHRLVTW